MFLGLRYKDLLLYKGKDAYDYFKRIFSDEALLLINNETNR